MREQIVIGGLIAGLCLFGLWHDRWLLAETRKGQRLAGWLGTNRGLWVVRGCLGAGALLGISLAAGLLQPLQW